MDRQILDNLEKKGYVSFGFAEGGFSYMMSDKPLMTMADVQNQKVWSPSGNKISEVVFRTADVAPVTLPISDVITGLQTGLSFPWQRMRKSVPEGPKSKACP